MRNITRIKLQLHLRITFISSTWSMYSYYNIYIYIYKKEKSVFCANINQTFDRRCVSYFHRFHYFYREYLLLRSRFIFYWFPLSKQITRFVIQRGSWLNMIWFPLFKLRWKEYFYNFNLRPKRNCIYIYIYDKFVKLISFD